MENIVNILTQREILSGRNYRRAIDTLLEKSFFEAKEKHRANDVPLQESVLSTIAIALSPDGETVATSHGDHTIKVFNFHDGKSRRIFYGHPRTPWTVKYHPTDSNIIASGCLGYEVRIWDIKRNMCVNMIRYEYSIISLAFHPAGNLIAIASGPQLHTWDWKEEMPAIYGGYPIGQGSIPHRRTVVHSRNIRAVMFHPSGDFILAAAPDPPRMPAATFTPCRLYAFKFRDILDATTPKGMSPIELWTQHAIIPQIHLYSDGGLDISQDGNYILTCAILYVAPSSRLSERDKLMSYPPAMSPISHRERSDADDDEQLRAVGITVGELGSTLPTSTTAVGSYYGSVGPGALPPSFLTAGPGALPLPFLTAGPGALPLPFLTRRPPFGGAAATVVAGGSAMQSSSSIGDDATINSNGTSRSMLSSSLLARARGEGAYTTGTTTAMIGRDSGTEEGAAAAVATAGEAAHLMRVSRRMNLADSAQHHNQPPVHQRSTGAPLSTLSGALYQHHQQLQQQQQQQTPSLGADTFPSSLNDQPPSSSSAAAASMAVLDDPEELEARILEADQICQIWKEVGDDDDVVTTFSTIRDDDSKTRGEVSSAAYDQVSSLLSTRERQRDAAAAAAIVAGGLQREKYVRFEEWCDSGSNMMDVVVDADDDRDHNASVSLSDPAAAAIVVGGGGARSVVAAANISGKEPPTPTTAITEQLPPPLFLEGDGGGKLKEEEMATAMVPISLMGTPTMVGGGGGVGMKRSHRVSAAGGFLNMPTSSTSSFSSSSSLVQQPQPAATLQDLLDNSCSSATTTANTVMTTDKPADASSSSSSSSSSSRSLSLFAAAGESPPLPPPPPPPLALLMITPPITRRDANLSLFPPSPPVLTHSARTSSTAAASHLQLQLHAASLTQQPAQFSLPQFSPPTFMHPHPGIMMRGATLGGGGCDVGGGGGGEQMKDFNHITTAANSSSSSGNRSSESCSGDNCQGNNSRKSGISGGTPAMGGNRYSDSSDDPDICGSSCGDANLRIPPIFAVPRNGDKIPAGWKPEENLCIFKFNVHNGNILPPELIRHKALTAPLMKAVTSAKLSPTGAYALVGYGVRSRTGVVEDHPCRYVACETMSVESVGLQTVSVITDVEDEVNIAQFHVMCGAGVLYGTKRGKVKVFRRNEYEQQQPPAATAAVANHGNNVAAAAAAIARHTTTSQDVVQTIRATSPL